MQKWYLSLNINLNIEKQQQNSNFIFILQHWSVCKVQVEFGAYNFIFRKAKQLVKEKGIFSTPNSHVVIWLDAWYRCMAGKKNRKVVIEGGVKSRIEKQLLLSNMKELYELFKEKYAEKKIGSLSFVSSDLKTLAYKCE